jgi:glyoxylase-like metal-dependent hydrolase (beta-lactamase superfamily II)
MPDTLRSSTDNADARIAHVRDRVRQVADDVFHVRGTEVNWYLVRDGADVTLIDSGYPGDLGRVEESVRTIGRRPEDVRAVLLTHAHVDHMGAAQHFADRYGTSVLTDEVEARHAHREFLEQAGPLDVTKNLWRPGVLPWLTKVMRVGAARNVTIPSAAQFPAAAALDLPGRPVPVPTRGHTSGHTCYFLPTAGAVCTGDELVTGHAVSRTTGPQLPPAFFQNRDTRDAVLPLAELAADLILPGHGNPLRMPIAQAVRQAREETG